MNIRLSVVCLLLVLPLLVGAGTPEEQIAIERSEAMIEAGDYVGAVGTLAPHVESDDPKTAYALAYAHMIHATVGREQGEADLEEVLRAIKFAERAVQGGNAAGFNLLYMIHANGYGVPRDFAKAADYLKRGAEAGDTSAKLNYAVSLYEGNAVIPRNRGLACPLIRELSGEELVQGLIAHQLGMVTIRGHCGLAPDPEAGVKLLRIAASRGVTGAERDLAMALERGIGGARDEVEALDWFERAASHGDGYSLWVMGMAHVKGRHRVPDPATAVDYFERSAAAGNANGMASLAVMHATGSGVAQDHVKARALYEQSANGGNAHAHRGLAVMHAKGEGGPRNPVRGRTFYLMALELGDPPDLALRDALEAGMTPDQIEQSDRQFRAWLESRGD